VAIVGGGPAGLSAALLLGRSCRRVLVCDNGKPRNRAALAVNGYLGLDGCAPAQLRSIGRQQCAAYGVTFADCEVVAARALKADPSRFELTLLNGTTLRARKLLIATGVVDELPTIPDIAEFYGRSVHHCPYCDGWEHKGQRLIAYGNDSSVASLAEELLGWSRTVTVCTNGDELSQDDVARLQTNQIAYYDDEIAALQGKDGLLQGLKFTTGQCLPCDAMFFSSGRKQQAKLAEQLGCKRNENNLLNSTDKQGSGVPGLFLAGDADGEVQFAIVAAAEGAIAATAINREIQREVKT
jgi:thioredoxin reductase